jgi:hypothetical protein
VGACLTAVWARRRPCCGLPLAGSPAPARKCNPCSLHRRRTRTQDRTPAALERYRRSDPPTTIRGSRSSRVGRYQRHATSARAMMLSGAMSRCRKLSLCINLSASRSGPAIRSSSSCVGGRVEPPFEVLPLLEDHHHVGGRVRLEHAGDLHNTRMPEPRKRAAPPAGSSCAPIRTSLPVSLTWAARSCWHRAGQNPQGSTLLIAILVPSFTSSAS